MLQSLKSFDKITKVTQVTWNPKMRTLKLWGLLVYLLPLKLLEYKITVHKIIETMQQKLEALR